MSVPLPPGTGIENIDAEQIKTVRNYHIPNSKNKHVSEFYFIFSLKISWYPIIN